MAVDGRLLVGAAAERRGGALWLPLRGVAKILGDTVVVDPGVQRILVRRQNGVRAEYRQREGEVREDGAAVLIAKAPTLILDGAGPLWLPSEILAALLEVEIVVDPRGQVQVRRRGTGAPEAGRPMPRGLVDLHEARYALNNNTTGNHHAYNLLFNSRMRVHDGLTSTSLTFNGGTGQVPFDLQLARIAHVRPSGQQFKLMDFGAGGDLPFVSAQVRGVWYRQPLARRRQIISFIGATPSGVDEGSTTSFERYQGFITGSYLALGRASRKDDEDRPLTGTAGGMFFHAATRRGGLLAGSASYRAERWQARADLGLGAFDGETLGAPSSGVAGDGAPSEAERAADFALAVDLSGGYRPIDRLRLQGQVGYLGERFLAPQLETTRPMLQSTLGVDWAALDWLSAAVGGRWAEFHGSDGRDLELTARLLANLPSPWPSASLEHAQGSRVSTGLVATSRFRLDWERGRYRLGANLLRVELGEADPTYAATLSGAVQLARVHRFRYAQSVADSGAHGGAFDWDATLIKGHADLGAGFGYDRAFGRTTTFGRALVRARLPLKQTLQLSYSHGEEGFQLYASLSGPLYDPPKPKATSSAALRDYGDLRGRVYQDRNLNRRYDPKVDRPQAGVQIKVDGAYFVRTGKDGTFVVSDLPPGKHTVKLGLLTVRAELTFLDGTDRQVVLKRGRGVAVDFRLARSGGMTGTVWIDENGNGKLDEGEQGLADVRIVTGNRDTLTDETGEFIVGDMVPGEHRVLIDEKTLPDDVEAIGGARSVKIEPGKRKGGIDLPTRKKPEKVEVLEFPPASQPTSQPASRPNKAGAKQKGDKPDKGKTPNKPGAPKK